MNTNCNKQCIVCLKVEGLTPLTLKPSRESLEKIKTYARQRASYGETSFSPLCDRIADLTDEEFVQATYHSGCYKNIVNNEKLKRAEKRFREYSLSSKSVLPPKKGRPSRSDSLSSDDYVTVKRSRRSTSTPRQTKTCVFQCSHPTTGELHRVETDILWAAGLYRLKRKHKTKTSGSSRTC